MGRWVKFAKMAVKRVVAWKNANCLKFQAILLCVPCAFREALKGCLGRERGAPTPPSLQKPLHCVLHSRYSLRRKHLEVGGFKTRQRLADADPSLRVARSSSPLIFDLVFCFLQKRGFPGMPLGGGAWPKSGSTEL